MKKEGIKKWINDVYTKLWELFSLYEETDGFNIVPEGEAEENPQDFIGRKMGEISNIEFSPSLYMDEQEIAELRKLRPSWAAMDSDDVVRYLDSEAGEITDELDKIMEQTRYFFTHRANRQVVFGWGLINPHLIYFDLIFDLMEKYPETYMEMEVQEGQFVHLDPDTLKFRAKFFHRSPEYPSAKLVAERNAYFEKIKERNERENLNWSKEKIFQEELLNTLKLLFEDAFKEYL